MFVKMGVLKSQARQQVFMQNGKGNVFEGKNGVQAIALALGYVMPEKEAKATAKRLTGIFGSFSGVLEAPEGELEAVGGVDAKTADYLQMLGKLTEYYIEDKNTRLKRVYDSKFAYEVLKPEFIGRKTEAVILLLLDGRGRVCYNEVINEGSISEVPIYIRRIVELCLKYDAYTSIIAHNHPSGNPIPSKNDIHATRDIEFALNGIDVELYDHIIFAGTDYLSMKSSAWLERIKDEVNIYKEAMKKESEEQENAIAYLHGPSEKE